MTYNYCNATEIAARLPYMLPMSGERVSVGDIKLNLAPIIGRKPTDSLVIDAADKLREMGIGVEIKRLGGELMLRRLL